MAELSQTFRTTLFAAGGNNVAIVVPPEVVAAFGRGKRVPVVVTVDGGYSYRNTIATDGRAVPALVQRRDAAGPPGVGPATRWTFDSTSTTSRGWSRYPTTSPSGLADDVAARAAWERLSYSRQREHVESITGAKTPQTRARCVQKVLSALRDCTPPRALLE